MTHVRTSAGLGSYRSYRSALKTSLGCVLSAALVLAPGTPLLAQGKKPAAAKDAKADQAKRDKAREAFKRGEEKLAAGEFAAAAEAYKEANSILPSPQAQYKVALALDKAGKAAEASEAYKAFLAAPPPESMGEQKGAAEKRIGELAKGSIKITSNPPGATVKIDGERSLDVTPVVVVVKPGPHKIELSAPDREPASREVTVAAGATAEVTIELGRAAPPPPPPPTPAASSAAPVVAPPPPPPAEPKSKVPAYVTLGVGGAAAIVGTLFGLKALSAKKDFDDKPTEDNADKAEKNALIADMAFGVALTLGITGTVLLLTSDSKPDEPVAKTGKLRFAPILTPQTQGAAATFRF